MASIKTYIMDRVSPIGYWHFAEAYALAAQSVLDGPRLRFEDPIFHLFEHALELSLKAFLLANECKVSEIKSYGHGLPTLLREARARGLEAYHKPTDALDAVIDMFYAFGKDENRLRYFKRDYIERLDINYVKDAVHNLMRDIKPLCFREIWET